MSYLYQSGHLLGHLHDSPPVPASSDMLLPPKHNSTTIILPKSLANTVIKTDLEIHIPLLVFVEKQAVLNKKVLSLHS